MAELIIDPFVFACPHPDEGIDTFRSFIQSILSWKDLHDARWARVFISNQTIDVLSETNTYPLWDGLQALIAEFHIQDVQPRDIVGIVNALLMKLPAIEDHAGIKDLLYDEPKSTPNSHLIRRQALFVDQYFRIGLIICLLAELNNSQAMGHMLITRLLSEDLVRSEIEATIHAHDLDAGKIALDAPPIHIKSRLDLCNTPHGLFLAVDPLQIWGKAETDQECAQALHLFLYQKVYETRRHRISATDFQWSLGGAFCASVVQKGFLNNPPLMKALLRACAETILSERMTDVHTLREGRGAEERQIRRGSDKAWRREIDREYRLHYWETAEGPELAYLASHNESHIP
jgi:hypothetical protein